MASGSARPVAVAARRRARFRAMAAVGVWLAAAPAAAQAQQESPAARAQGDAEDPRWIDFSFDGKPSIRIGSEVRVDVRLKSQLAWNDFPDGSDDAEGDAFDLQRARLGIEGRVSRYVEYQVEREMRGTRRPWRDVFVDVRPLRAFRLQVGRFKMPFSLDQTTGSMDGSFAYRSLAATYLAPSRDEGVMAHGALLRNAIRYEAGLFRRGGENARVNENDGGVDERTTAGRITARPFSALSAIPSVRSLTVGAAFTTGRVPEGLNGLAAETIPGDTLVEPVYVNGRRTRLGAELQWRPGPASIQGEVIRVSEERRGQGIYNDDLPDAIRRGWYLSGTWLVTGEEKKDNVNPARPLLQGGFGALEIAGRVEAISFGSSPTSDTPLAGPRARRMLEVRNQVWTAGVNWYLNRFVRVQTNLIRDERAQGGVRRAPAWTRTVRVQFQL